uniref:Vestigial-like family member 2a n=1 Tax=Monopterus albus TaxID=43700 RepID=A0A3Q3ILG6_MONAL
MSCLDVMYQVFGPQPYFSSYSPYHHQKLALYSKMQDPQDSGNGSFPMSQRSFPPSFWNSSYQPSVSSTLGSALSAPHTELSFPGDPYSSASLHSHLHQSSPDTWHPSHHHHHHHHHPYSLGGAIGSQSSAYPRPGVHEMYGTPFDQRYGSLLVPSVRPHHRLTSSSSVPGPSASPCDLGGKGESGTGSTWSGAFTGAGAEIGLNMDTGLQAQDKSKDLYWF